MTERTAKTVEGRTTLLALIAAAALLGVDQLIKYWANSALATARQIEVIPGLFSLTYIENRGAAFGILQGKTTLLSVVVSVVIVGALYLLLSGRIKNRFLIWSVALIISGGAGNLIDRMVHGYVIDYLDFSQLFDFPIFNFADCCVVVGSILILIYIIFLDRPVKESADSDAADLDFDSDSLTAETAESIDEDTKNAVAADPPAEPEAEL